MDKKQAGGYIFESIIAKLISRSGYVSVRKGSLKGRGAFHQIDAIGVLGIPTPFVYPIRLLSEAKHYTTSKVELADIRNYVGVIKDISENYFVNGPKDRGKKRYSDIGCFFSIGPYRASAQNYAWAHNIFIISFSMIDKMNRVSKDISGFVSVSKNIRGTIEEIVDKFWKLKGRSYLVDDILLVGVLNSSYPVVLSAKKSLLPKIISDLKGNDIMIAGKTTRRGSPEDAETIFNIRMGQIDEDIKLTLPDVIAWRLINKIDSSDEGDKVFEIDIPIIKQDKSTLYRRILKLDVRLGSQSNRKEYLSALENSAIN